MSNTPPTRTLSVGDVAERLQVSTRSVHRLVARGELPPPIRIGGLARWAESEIDQHVRGAA